jgi:glycosyltransferase involved in cell wall biosynthesis
MPKVTVIITTKNSETTLKELLKSLKKQSHKDIETVVVDNSSTDNTQAVSRQFTDLFFTHGPERSAQRNFGAKKAHGKYLFFLDSDMILTPTVISDCVETFLKEKNLGGVIVPEKSFGKNFWAKAKAFEREINEGEDYFEAARFFPKAVFEEFGGYESAITGPEDWDLPKRIAKKYEISRVPSYILHNEGSPTPVKLMKRKYYYGLSAYAYLSKNNIPTFSSQTVYFLRPAFYRQ